LESSNGIYQKLEAFIRYYTNELIRGSTLHRFRLVVFSFHAFVEYFLWLKPMARAVLFWTFVGVEVLLLLRFIVFPIFKLLKLQGIDYNEASIIIGSHFVDVNDSLTNFLQLSDSGKEQHSSELQPRSIKSKRFATDTFGNAINFKSNSKYFCDHSHLLFYFFMRLGTML
jgi:hypothetical protein